MCLFTIKIYRKDYKAHQITHNERVYNHSRNERFLADSSALEKIINNPFRRLDKGQAMLHNIAK